MEFLVYIFVTGCCFVATNEFLFKEREKSKDAEVGESNNVPEKELIVALDKYYSHKDSSHS